MKISITDIQKSLVHLDNKELAELGFFTWEEAQRRAQAQIEKEVEEALKVLDSNKKNV